MVIAKLEKHHKWCNMEFCVEVKAKKSVLKEVVKLPLKTQELYREFIHDLERDGPGVQGWELKKMGASSNEYQAKINQNYRMIMEYVKPDIIIIKVASREGA
jgi:mRNA-degrading endonuclease RelE of RelBE toxin-antitoxin system